MTENERCEERHPSSASILLEKEYPVMVQGILKGSRLSTKDNHKKSGYESFHGTVSENCFISLYVTVLEKSGSEADKVNYLLATSGSDDGSPHSAKSGLDQSLWPCLDSQILNHQQNTQFNISLTWFMINTVAMTLPKKNNFLHQKTENEKVSKI